jgi:hypothetical protein
LTTTDLTTKSSPCTADCHPWFWFRHIRCPPS